MHTHMDWCQHFSLTNNIDIAWHNFINLFYALALKLNSLK